MKLKNLLIVMLCFTSFLVACGNNANQNDGTGEMPEDQSSGTGDEPYMPEDTSDVDTLRLDSLQ